MFRRTLVTLFKRSARLHDTNPLLQRLAVQEASEGKSETFYRASFWQEETKPASTPQVTSPQRDTAKAKEYFEVAMGFMKKGDLESAKEQLDKAIKQDSQFEDAYLEKFRILGMQLKFNDLTRLQLDYARAFNLPTKHFEIEVEVKEPSGPKL